MNDFSDWLESVLRGPESPESYVIIPLVLRNNFITIRARLMRYAQTELGNKGVLEKEKSVRGKSSS